VVPRSADCFHEANDSRNGLLEFGIFRRRALESWIASLNHSASWVSHRTFGSILRQMAAGASCENKNERSYQPRHLHASMSEYAMNAGAEKKYIS
jgi:hypothetical protein